MQIIAEAQQENAWVGLTELTPNNWVWTTSQEPVTWNDWRSGEPNSIEQQCGHIWVRWETGLANGWADAYCYAELAFFCEYFQ